MLKQNGAIRILKSGVVIAAAISMCAPAVYADYEISYAGGDKPFIITGKTDIPKQNQTVTLRVKDEDGNTLYIKQNMTDTDGSYSFSFELDKDGKANVLVLEDDKEAAGEKQIFKSTPAEFAAVIERLNSKSESIDSVISDECELLGVDMVEYKDLKTNRIFLNYLENQKYDDFNDFFNAYDISKLFVMINRSKPAEETEKLGDKLITEADLEESNSGNIYKDMTDAEKVKLYEKLKGNKYESFDEFYDGLRGEIILEELDSVTNYNEKYTVLTENNDVLGLDLESVSKLGYNKEAFKKDLAKALRGIGSIDGIKKKFDELYEEYSEKEDSGNSHGGGGGGSKSSGGGGGTSSGGGSYQVNNDILPDIEYPERAYFKDLDGYDWAKEAIITLASKGIVRGREDLIFVPGDNITRAEFVKIITEAFELPAAEGTASEDFTDVPKDFWGYDYIMAARKTGVIKGISDTEFNPNGYISRQDMAVMCRRILSSLGKELTGVREVKFADEDDIASYATESVTELSNAAILNGKGNDMFDPYGCATRAEAAQMVYGILKAIS
ncbi:MAG: S-layer homology domain-containing protein [Clostridia bacterium]|nr:S-layer homology domain-containing protein [Clostridia bacterium]